MVLTGNVCAGVYGLSRHSASRGGRADVWEPEEDVYWGSEDTWLGDKRYSATANSKIRSARVQMGLIYVNPEGPNGKRRSASRRPRTSARPSRRMAMNDEETVALIAGGHTFGKTHGAGEPRWWVPAPEAAGIEEQGLGWKNEVWHGQGR